jgi:hypothetical protein
MGLDEQMSQPPSLTWRGSQDAPRPYETAQFFAGAVPQEQIKAIVRARPRTCFFAGAPKINGSIAKVAELRTTINLSSNRDQSALIRSGKALLDLRCGVSHIQTDQAHVVLEVLDDNNGVLGRVSDLTNLRPEVTGWQSRHLTLQPQGRGEVSARLRLRSIYHAGQQDSDGYFDLLWLTLRHRQAVYIFGDA